MLRTFEFKERRLGLRFVGRKGDVYVKNVILGLEAERVGVLEGDVIVSVNGTSVRSIRNTMDLLKSRPLRVTFRRGRMNGTSLLQYWKVVWSGGLNLRRDPSPRAEIVGIARFGEVYLSTKKQGDWICVANKSSLGESWVLSKSDDEMYMCRTTKTAAETTTTANILKKTSSSSLKNETQQQSTLSQDNEKLSSQSRDLDKPSIEPLPPSLSHNHDNHHNNKHNNNNNKLNFETLEKFGYGGYENTAIYREYSHQVKHLQASEKRKIESIKQLKRERQKRKREDEKREKERIQKLLDLNAQERSTLQAIFHDRKISSVEKKKKKKKKKIGQDSITTTTNTITHNTDDSNLHSVRSNPWLRNNSNQTF